MTQISFYQKRFTTKTTTTKGGGATKSFTDDMKNNVVQSYGAKTQREMTNIFTRPFPVPGGNTQKNTNLQNYMADRIPSKNKLDYSKYNKSAANNFFSNNSY